MIAVMTLHQAIGRMLNTHPQRGPLKLDEMAHAVESCVICATTCVACADACLAERHVQKLTHCIRINLDCADICRATGHMLVRQTEPDWRLLQHQLEACRTACRICAAVCEQHAEMHEHCRVCAEACRQCEQACDAILRHFAPNIQPLL